MKPKSHLQLASALVGLLLLSVSACSPSAQSAVPTTTPVYVQPTLIPTQTESAGITQISIDGRTEDWVNRTALLDDPAGDAEQGYLDLTIGYAFVNQNALYFLVESVDPAAPFVQFDMQFQVGSRILQISWAPGQQTGFLCDVTSGWKPIGEIHRSQFAFDPALEGRVDLHDMESPTSLNLISINVMAGECCNYPEWRAVEQWQPGSTPATTRHATT